MENLKNIIAKNIADLRIKNEMTQFMLAEKLNYSDKAVSKWERGESIPDITVLKEIADLFNVKVDYLLSLEHDPVDEPIVKKMNIRKKVVVTLSVLLVWLIATFSFVVALLADSNCYFAWLAFIYAIPVSSIVLIVFNTMWYKKKINYILVSLLMWSIFLSLHLSFLLLAGINIALIYVIGAPGQIIIMTWFFLRKEVKG